MTHRTLSVSLVTTGLLLSLFFSGCKKPIFIPGKEGKAMAMASGIGLGVWAYEQDYKDLNPLFGDKDYGITSADELIAVLSLQAPEKILAIKNRDKVALLDWPKGRGYTDPWGNSYFIAWQKLPHSVTDSVGNVSNYTFFVWSFGANRVNEFGQGDDIFSLNGQQMKWPKGEKTGFSLKDIAGKSYME